MCEDFPDVTPERHKTPSCRLRAQGKEKTKRKNGQAYKRGTDKNRLMICGVCG